MTYRSEDLEEMGMRLAPLWFRQAIFAPVNDKGELVLPPYQGGPTQDDADALLQKQWRARVEANMQGKRRPRSVMEDPATVTRIRGRINR